MATANSGDSGATRLADFFRETINWVVIAIIAGLFGTFLVANSATNGVANHETRIKDLENNPTRISVLETKVDTLTEQNTRLETKIDKLTDAITAQRSVRNDR